MSRHDTDKQRCGGAATRPAGRLTRRPRTTRRVRRAFGFIGAATALPFFVWLPLGWLDPIPSMVEVFGAAGLRAPAGVTVAGLLLAAVGFYED